LAGQGPEGIIRWQGSIVRKLSFQGGCDMPIRFVCGDLFANRFKAQALAHGCNCRGSMGAGIATGFRDRYPRMYAEFRRRCKADPPEFKLGGAFLWKASGRPWVFNLGTQEGIWWARASYEAIESALRSMRQQAEREGIASIALPRIGAGYGGLSWKKVKALLERVFGDWMGTLYVYEEYAPEKRRCRSTSTAAAKSATHSKKRIRAR
jgi:O-acetyl-ADP-ribose deacetylase (regulator of RNase III)